MMPYQRYYAGIGSRKTPEGVLPVMTRVAKKLDEWDYILRSGGANGADSAFERGATKKEIFLPWRGFNGNKSPLYTISPKAVGMAAFYHPAWDRCSSVGKKLHARNCQQILGDDLETPCHFVVCWTPGGKMVGGTAQALRIAMDYGIRIFNLGKGYKCLWGLVELAAPPNHD